MIRVAIIGAGAVAEIGHLPALAASSEARCTLLVDEFLPRAETLAKRFGVSAVTNRLEEVREKADAAIVAVPHHLHATIAAPLLEAGVHVLVEKPMALTEIECRRIIDAANRGKATLAVGLFRRFLWSARFAKMALDQAMLGELRSFDVQEGNVFTWPLRSDFQFRHETGGGVLFDTGAHTLDLLLWWLGELSPIEYCDDRETGVAAECRIRLRTASGIEGNVELSRTRDLRNTARIECAHGTLELGLRTNDVTLRPAGGDLRLLGNIAPPGRLPPRQDFRSLFQPQLADWLDAIQQRRSPFVTGEAGLMSVRLMAKLPQRRKPYRFPWEPGSEIGHVP